MLLGKIHTVETEKITDDLPMKLVRPSVNASLLSEGQSCSGIEVTAFMTDPVLGETVATPLDGNRTNNSSGRRFRRWTAGLALR